MHRPGRGTIDGGRGGNAETHDECNVRARCAACCGRVTYNWAIIPKLTKRRDDGFLLTPGHFSVLFYGQLVGKCAFASIYLFISNVWANTDERNPKKTKSLVPRRASSRPGTMARDPNTPKAPRPKKKPKNKDVTPPPERNETPEVRLSPHLRIVSRRQSARPPERHPSILIPSPRPCPPVPRRRREPSASERQKESAAPRASRC